MKKKLIALTLVIGLISTGTAQAVYSYGSLGLIGKQENTVACAGSKLVIEEREPNVIVRFGKLLGEYADDTITVMQGGEVILAVKISKDDKMMKLDTLVENVKILTDLCTMNIKEHGIFAKLAELIVLPKLNELGIWDNNELYQSACGDGGYAGGFVLILVLFILLVIIGAGFGEEPS